MPHHELGISRLILPNHFLEVTTIARNPVRCLLYPACELGIRRRQGGHRTSLFFSFLFVFFE